MTTDPNSTKHMQGFLNAIDLVVILINKLIIFMIIFMFFPIVFYDIKLNILGFFNFGFTETPIYVKLTFFVI